jgi:hypothetical protein
MSLNFLSSFFAFMGLCQQAMSITILPRQATVQASHGLLARRKALPGRQIVDMMPT